MESTKEEQINREVGEAFGRAAMGLAICPTICTRFVATNTQTPGEVSIAFGSGVIIEFGGGTPRSETSVHVASAVAIKKNVAEDLIVNLINALGITEQDLAAATARNAHLKLPEK